MGEVKPGTKCSFCPEPAIFHYGVTDEGDKIDINTCRQCETVLRFYAK